jgi:phospholipid transport system substrate-binding protein
MTPRRLLVTAVAAALAIVIASPAWAASPQKVLETFFERANAILRSVDPESGFEAPRQAIRALVNELFDYQDAAAQALGPVWHSKTPGQQAEFVRLFAEILERGYVAFVGSKVSVSDGLKITFVEESVTGDAAAVATTLLSRNGSDLDVDYIMARRDERWMVRDVIVDGVSLVANYRAQFNRVLATATYADLVARMQPDALEPPQSAPAVAPALAAAPAPVQPAQLARPVPSPAVISSALVAPRPAPGEALAAARPREDAAPKAEAIRVSAPERKAPEMASGTGAGPTGAIRYWIQVGAFKTVGAAVHLAERLRREGLAASNNTLTSAPWHPAGALTRVRVGPFATQSDAQSTLRELAARGYAPFIATVHN